MKCFSAKTIRTFAFSFGGVLPGLVVLFIFTSKPTARMPSYSMLCLGDSYTIGESVLPNENFPTQCINLLRRNKFDFGDPRIVAVTGWTTGDLSRGIDNCQLKTGYDFVTLLIGVNNQYRGRTVEQYSPEFESLLKRAIQFADGKPRRVIVLSIPDWGATPYAKYRNKNEIANEIDDYNAANKKVSAAYGVNYLDITADTRLAASDPTLVAEDGLHPSAKEYAKWARRIYVIIKEQLQYAGR